MKRKFDGFIEKVIHTYASFFTILQIIMLLSNIDARIKYVFFLGFVLSLTFLKYKPTKKSKDNIGVLDIIFSVVSIISMIYYMVNYENILNRSLQPTVYDIGFASITILLVLEACRRTVGLVLPAISIIVLIYAFWGDNLPGIWAHRDYSLSRIVNILYMTDNGIFGSITKVAATTVFAFMILGVFFKKTSVGNVITELITALTGKFYGGSALVSVISSSLFGMISGSAASNVVTTGQFTIPMMKKNGFKPEFAAAVEAAASAGGTLTPPVLGAAVFVMVEITGIAYNTIAKATIIPALIFYLSVLFMVYFTARKMNIKGNESSLNTKKIFSSNLICFIPIVFLIIFTLVGYPLINSAIVTTIIMIIVSLVFKKTNIRDIVSGIGDIGITCLPTAMACICSGIVIGILNLTGLTVRVSELIIGLSGVNIILALFATMIMLIILGMGLPAVASYIIGSSIAAPVLISIGIPVLPAHLFIFYFSCLSSITPPIALNAYLAAGIADSNPIKTGFVACKLCLPIFVVPYMFVYQPALMFQGEFLRSVLVTVTCVLGTMLISMGIVGYIKEKQSVLKRIVCIMLGFLFIDSDYATDLIAVMVIVMYFMFRLILKEIAKLKIINEAKKNKIL